MAIRKPYYGLHQIIPGKYTAGNEFILADGTDYEGAYHILPTNQKFTGEIPNKKSQELFEKRSDVSELVKRYNRLMDVEVSRYVSPVPYQPSPTPDDYEIGEIQRFFVQKINNPTATITEIDGQQYNSINYNNSPGINGVLWNSLLIRWRISRIPAKDVAVLNRRTLVEAANTFTGIGLYITNVLEYYR